MTESAAPIIRLDDPRRAPVTALLRDHLDEMAVHSPPESIHALDVDALCGPDITFWTVSDAAGAVIGCGALRELDSTHAEIKSMRTDPTHRRGGIARQMLEHILEEARRRGFRRLSLETGSQPGFEPARALYARYGFEVCGPFGDYGPDPNSVFMTREIP